MSITFHILEKSNNQQALLHACQLIEKHHQDGERIYIHAATKAQADQFDQLLWTFKDDSFIAHQVCPTDTTVPVQIGYDASHAVTADILINLSGTFPEFYANYKNTVEIVFADPTVQQLARERFKKYRDLGCELTTLKK